MLQRKKRAGTLIPIVNYLDLMNRNDRKSSRGRTYNSQIRGTDRAQFVLRVDLRNLRSNEID